MHQLEILWVTVWVSEGSVQTAAWWGFQRPPAKPVRRHGVQPLCCCSLTPASICHP